MSTGFAIVFDFRFAIFEVTRGISKSDAKVMVFEALSVFNLNDLLPPK